MDLQNIGVIGAGTMGNGIAQVCAQAGFDVILLDISESALHSKLQGQTQFKLNEAENLSAMLGMTMSERDACFFDTQNRYERSLAAAERRKPK